jgi:hypothetical protein
MGKDSLSCGPGRALLRTMQLVVMLALPSCRGSDPPDSHATFDYGWTLRLGGTAGESISQTFVNNDIITAQGSTGSARFLDYPLKHSGAGLFATEITTDGVALSIDRYDPAIGFPMAETPLNAWAGPFGGTATTPDATSRYELLVADANDVRLPYCLRRWSDPSTLEWERCFGTEADPRGLYAQPFGVLALTNGDAAVVVTARSSFAFELLDKQTEESSLLIVPEAMKATRAVVLLLDRRGDLQHVEPLDSSGFIESQVMAEDASGALYVGGATLGNSSVLGATGLTQSSDMFVLKLDAHGVAQGARVWGGVGEERVDQLKLLTDDSLIVAGVFEGEVDFGPGDEQHWLKSAGMNDAFITRFSFVASDDTQLPLAPTCSPQEATYLPTTFDECALRDEARVDGRFCSMPAVQADLQPAEYAECTSLGGTTGFHEASNLFYFCLLEFDRYNCMKRGP